MTKLNNGCFFFFALLLYCLQNIAIAEEALATKRQRKLVKVLTKETQVETPDLLVSRTVVNKTSEDEGSKVILDKLKIRHLMGDNELDPPHDDDADDDDDGESGKKFPLPFLGEDNYDDFMNRIKNLKHPKGDGLSLSIVRSTTIDPRKNESVVPGKDERGNDDGGPRKPWSENFSEGQGSTNKVSGPQGGRWAMDINMGVSTRDPDTKTQPGGVTPAKHSRGPDDRFSTTTTGKNESSWTHTSQNDGVSGRRKSSTKFAKFLSSTQVPSRNVVIDHTHKKLEDSFSDSDRYQIKTKTITTSHAGLTENVGTRSHQLNVQKSNNYSRPTNDGRGRGVVLLFPVTGRSRARSGLRFPPGLRRASILSSGVDNYNNPSCMSRLNLHKKSMTLKKDILKTKQTCPKQLPCQSWGSCSHLWSTGLITPDLSLDSDLEELYFNRLFEDLVESSKNPIRELMKNCYTLYGLAKKFKGGSEAEVRRRDNRGTRGIDDGLTDCRARIMDFQECFWFGIWKATC